MILEFAILISIVANFGASASAIEPASERGSFCESVLASTVGLGDEQIQQIFEIIIEKLPPEDLRALLENPLAAPAFSAPDLRMNEGRTFEALLAKMESEGQFATDQLKNKWKKIFSEKLEHKISEERASSKKTTGDSNRYRDSSDFLFHIAGGAWKARLIDHSKKLAVITQDLKKYQLWDLQTKTRLIEVPNPYGTHLQWTDTGEGFYYKLESGTTGLFSNTDIGRINDSQDAIQSTKPATTSSLCTASPCATAFHRRPWLAIRTEKNDRKFLEIWEPHSGEKIGEKLLPKDLEHGRYISISKNDEHIALNFLIGSSWYWNRKSNQTFSLPNTRETRPKFSPDSQFIIFDTENNWSPSKIFRLNGEDGPIEIESATGKSFRFLSDNRLMYLASDDRSLKIRDLKVGSSSETTIPLHYASETAHIYFSPKGNFYLFHDFGNETLALFHIKNNLNAQATVSNYPTLIRFLNDVPALFLVFRSGEVRQIDLSEWEQNP